MIVSISLHTVYVREDGQVHERLQCTWFPPDNWVIFQVSILTCSQFVYVLKGSNQFFLTGVGDKILLDVHKNQNRSI